MDRSDKRDRESFEDIDEFLNQLSENESFWELSDSSHDIVDMWTALNERFDLQNPDTETVLKTFDNHKEQITALYYDAIRCHAVDQSTMDQAHNYHEDSGNDVGLDEYSSSEVIRRISRLLRIVDVAHRVIGNSISMKNSLDKAYNASGDRIEEMFSCITYNKNNLTNGDDQKKDELKDHQDLILYLLNQICIYGYRRVDNDMYKQIFLGGNATHAWGKACSIQHFIHQNCQKETRGKFWRKLTNKLGTAQSVEDHLSKCVDCQFPDLVHDRHVFSFTNGLFVANNYVGSELVPKFFSYTDDNISPSLVSAVYHEQEFPMDILRNILLPEQITTNLVESIDTPELTDILSFQRLSREVQLWVFVFIGRMVFETNEGDNWQVMPFLKGVAGSGKSTIIYDVISKIFNPEDVFMVSNNCEKKFGLQNCLKSNGTLKLICLMPEVKADFSMEQGDWQQAVSGERIPINRKHSTTVTQRFTMPMFAAGNQMIGYDDNSNSVARRVPVIKFNYPVGVRQDGEKPKKLQRELSRIVLKATLAYAWASNNYGKQNIWNVLPPEFQNEKKILIESQHALMNYLNSGKVLFKAELYCPQKTFISNFKSHVQDNCLTKFRWCTDFYETAFAEHYITIVKNCKKMYDDKSIHGVFYLGVDIVDGDSSPSQRYLDLVEN
jgi:hypothetical protein